MAAKVKVKIRFRLEEHVDYYTGQGIQVNLLMMGEVCYDIRRRREGLGPVCSLGSVDPLLVPRYLRSELRLFRAVDGGRLDTFLEFNTDRGL